MRNISINDVDHSPRGVLAIGTDYPPGHVLAAHEHRRAQFLFAVNGAMNVETEDGEWTVLPSNAVMIPAGVAHAVTMDGVSTRSLYIESSAAPWFPVRCRVVAVSSLLRELLVAAVDVDVELNVEDDFTRTRTRRRGTSADPARTSRSCAPTCGTPAASAPGIAGVVRAVSRSPVDP